MLVSRVLFTRCQYLKSAANHAHYTTYRFEYSLPPPSSWEGEPALLRVVDADAAFIAETLPNGDFIEVPGGGSIGEVAAVDEPDRGCVGLGPSWGR